MRKNWHKELKLFKEVFSVNFLRIFFLMVTASILTYAIFPKYHYINYYTRFNKITGSTEEIGKYKGKIKWISIEKLEKEQTKQTRDFYKKAKT